MRIKLEGLANEFGAVRTQPGFRIQSMLSPGARSPIATSDSGAPVTAAPAGAASRARRASADARAGMMRDENRSTIVSTDRDIQAPVWRRKISFFNRWPSGFGLAPSSHGWK